MADILSRLAICRRLNIKNREIELNFNRYGKPLLQGNEALHFNNSHSGSWAVSAISSAPIGVDMEQIGEAHLEIAERFFSPQEYSDLLLRKEGEARREYFFDLWTLKESYIKAVGMGLSLSLSSFTIRKNNERIVLNTQNEFKACFFRQYAIDTAYRLSLCAANDSFPDHVTLLSFEEMTQAFLEYM
ncbi:4'-phosphopantetheinyl transferase superfamily protein [Paenibacillus sp. LC-T2]|uniref:4'-phosphopantetheinyl transferase superfamily protein n=2 Tax=Paenibacillus monticola TaxID=2666075 RepID=A0A7X2L401_9BACL|nr:4'-phosphopantetheinyl transferase superfamily protein [Paenibacillus monticola]MRN54891.1 4'-phosphopantetheinyl transferase superfamily protein [Paenibacillus monticola]